MLRSKKCYLTAFERCADLRLAGCACASTSGTSNTMQLAHTSIVPRFAESYKIFCPLGFITLDLRIVWGLASKVVISFFFT
jgi:hypothetical protein